MIGGPESFCFYKEWGAFGSRGAPGFFAGLYPVNQGVDTLFREVERDPDCTRGDIPVPVDSLGVRFRSRETLLFRVRKGSGSPKRVEAGGVEC